MRIMERKQIWFSPGEINFSRQQLVTFLLPNLLDLRQGMWPRENRETGYDKETKSPNKNKRAPFEYACQIAAEIDARLALIGPQSAIVELLAVYDAEPLQVARDYNMSEEKLYKEYRQMLNFISGWRRRRCQYSEWKLVGRVFYLLSFDSPKSP